MEADLAVLGVDLRDLYSPGGGQSRLTPRRLKALVRAIPPGSEIQKSLGASMTLSRTDLFAARQRAALARSEAADG